MVSQKIIKPVISDEEIAGLVKETNIRRNSFFKKKLLKKNKKINNRFFRSLDGTYNSFWIGKFINSFIKKGNKETASRKIYLAFRDLKFSTRIFPPLFILEMLEKIKPVFKLENRFPKKKIIICPAVVPISKLYKVALKWIVLDLALRDHRLKEKIAISFQSHVYNKLLEFNSIKHHRLVKTRDNYHIEAVKLQQNLRFTWRKVTYTKKRKHSFKVRLALKARRAFKKKQILLKESLKY